MSKIVAYTALLYGAEYLEYAIRSVIDAVDAFWFLYSPVGSHDGRKPVSLPPGEDVFTLYEIARKAAGNKFRWYENTGWRSEAEQRNTIFSLAPDADRIVVVDADEVWGPGLAQAVLGQSFLRPDIHDWLVPMIHLWRGFDRAIVHDPAYPVRVINPAAQLGRVETFDAHVHDEARRELLERTTDYVPEFHSRIIHAGYAISPELMRAKWETHGHKAQLRQDIDWFTERYENPEAVRDLHPVGSEYWNAEPINIMHYAPMFLMEHPRYAQAVYA